MGSCEDGSNPSCGDILVIGPVHVVGCEGSTGAADVSMQK